MFAGDKYALLRTIADPPPTTRLRHSLTRTSEPLGSDRLRPEAPEHGAISRQIAEIPPPDQHLILDPNPSIASLVQPADIESH